MAASGALLEVDLRKIVSGLVGECAGLAWLGLLRSNGLAAIAAAGREGAIALLWRLFRSI